MHRHLNSREAKRLHTKEPVFPVGRMDAEVMDPGSRRVCVSNLSCCWPTVRVHTQLGMHAVQEREG